MVKGRLLVLLVLMGGGSCQKHPAPSHGLRDAGSARPLVALASASAAPQRTVDVPVRDLLEARRFEEAYSALSKLAPDKRAEPYVALAMGYLGSRVGQGEAGLAVLEDLQRLLPEHSRLIERLRAESKLQTGDALAGAEWLAADGQQDAWVDASQTLLRLGKPAEARVAIDRALASSGLVATQPGRETAARLRIARAKMLGSSEPTVAAADWCWVAIEAPAVGLESKADAECERLGQRPLTAAQRRSRLEALAAAGAVEAVEQELTALLPSKVTVLSAAERALFAGRARAAGRREHLAGSRLLEQAVKHGAENPSSLLFEAARLAQRGGDGARAVALYDRLGSKFPKSRLDANYYAARTCLAFGRPKEAAVRYETYVRNERRPERSRLAAVEFALSLLSSGNFARAEPFFGLIARESKEDGSDTSKSDTWALATELGAVAALAAGKRERALSMFQEVVRGAPLSLFGLFARSRLRALGAPVVSPLGEAVPVRPEEVTVLLPEPARTLAEAGLTDLAALAFRAGESGFAAAFKDRAGPSVCQAWAQLGTADRRYGWSRTAVGALDVLRAPTPATRWQWDCRFPRPYEAMVESLARTAGVPTELVYAVMRQESGYRPAVRSPVGAQGLLQLMPTTAERLAQEVGWAAPGDVTEPRVNVTLGARYLRRLLDAFGANTVLAVASYNAGPEVVSHWVSAQPRMEADIFAATIPYTESRNYVSRVLSNYAVYLYLSGGEAALPELPLALGDVRPAPGTLY